MKCFLYHSNDYKLLLKKAQRDTKTATKFKIFNLTLQPRNVLLPVCTVSAYLDASDFIVNCAIHQKLITKRNFLIAQFPTVTCATQQAGVYPYLALDAIILWQASLLYVIKYHSSVSKYFSMFI